MQSGRSSAVFSFSHNARTKGGTTVSDDEAEQMRGSSRRFRARRGRVMLMINPRFSRKQFSPWRRVAAAAAADANAAKL